jgi:PPOX class probable F420-dependent enzyme
MVSTNAFAAVADTNYVSLRTLRKTGVAVDTPVWFAVSGDSLVVTTSREAGKVKRIRHTGGVELRECSMRGVVAEDAPVVLATATIEDSDEARAELRAVLMSKYGFTYRMMTFSWPFSKPKAPTSVLIRLKQRS